jgi:Ni,Fe-hydrogenase III small subunit/ferredoxin
MFDILLARQQQQYRTIAYPDGPAPELPPRFRGRPELKNISCDPECYQCVEVCPTNAITIKAGSVDRISVDLGKCLFCGACQEACPTKAICFSNEYRLAVRERGHLVMGEAEFKAATALEEKIRRVLGRSLKLRQVSAGGCNACEADTNVLGTVGWDLGRFGIQFVASPRHADGILVTGPVPENMRAALLKTYDAVPDPKIVIAVGACAIAGGPYIDHDEVHNGVTPLLPVDLFIPGCPPHPLTILDGLLRLIGVLTKDG